eukprot:1148038-Pelagomonas_calceolata.AAC.4
MVVWKLSHGDHCSQQVKLSASRLQLHAQSKIIRGASAASKQAAIGGAAAVSSPGQAKGRGEHDLCITRFDSTGMLLLLLNVQDRGIKNKQASMRKEVELLEGAQATLQTALTAYNEHGIVAPAQYIIWKQRHMTMDKTFLP